MATTERAPSATAAPDVIVAGDPRLTNEDLVPTPRAKRTWTTWSFAALWMGMVHNGA